MAKDYNNASICYTFTHEVLPTLALQNPNKFFRDVSCKKGCQYLQHLWKCVARKCSVFEEPPRITLEHGKLSNNMEICLISLPAPKNLLEAYYVAVVFRTRKRLFSKRVSEAHYFTLELGYDPHNRKEEQHVCEWLSVAPHPKRVNYGTIPSASQRLFTGVIEAALAKEILPCNHDQMVGSRRFVVEPKCGTVKFDRDHRATIIVHKEMPLSHSMGHIFLRNLYQSELAIFPEDSEELKQLVQKLEGWAGVTNGVWSGEQEEILVCQFDVWSNESAGFKSRTTGESVSPTLREAFEIMVPLDAKK